MHGRMIGNGRCLRAGGTLYLSEASVRNEEGELLAHGTSTLMLLKNTPMKAVLPVKFLD